MPSPTSFTTTGVPRCSAAATASSGVATTRSSTTGIPCAASKAFELCSLSVRPTGVCVQSDRAFAVLPELVSEHALQKLARIGARELVADLVRAGPLVSREPRLHKGAKLAKVEVSSLFGLHGRVHALSPLVVGDPGDRRVEELRVLVEHGLDLGRIDVHTARD